VANGRIISATGPYGRLSPRVYTPLRGANVCIVTPAQDAGVRGVIWKEIAEPVHAIRGRPRLITVSIQAMDGDNAEGNVRTRYCGRQDLLIQ
jgi:hypothetical protein